MIRRLSGLDQIGEQPPAQSTNGTADCLEDAVFGWDYPALRDMLLARGIPHLCLRGDQYQAPTAEEHAQLDDMVSAASMLQEARHG